MGVFRQPVLAGCLLLAAAVAGSGCAGNQYAGNPNSIPGAPAGYPAGGPPGAAPSPAQAQLQEAQRRIAELDANNRDLHAQLAQTQQQVTLYKDQLTLVQRQLNDTASQLRQAQSTRQELEQKAATLQASIRRRGGATITANNSIRQTLSAADLPGLRVVTEGDVIRIAIPADQLFLPGTATFTVSATPLLDRVADAIARNYPRNRVAIEGHTDSGGGAPGAASSHHLSASQAQGVFEQLTRRNRLPARQLFVVAHGDNHPRVSNATPAGRAENRRVEIVIYPEAYSGS